MSIDTKIKFVPLSFVNTHEELKRQIINTTIWSYYAKNGEPDLLGNLLDSTQYGYTASASDSGSHKLLRITDILNGSVKWEQVPYCDCNKSKDYLLQVGDILVARTGGTTGKSFLVKDAPNNAVFASYLIRLRAKEKMFEPIIYSMMNSYLFWSQITELKSGSAQPNVNAEKLKKILIPKIDTDVLPEIIEVLNGNLGRNKELQKKISEVENKLNQLEEVNSQFSHQEKLIIQLRQSILQDAIQGKLVAQNPHDERASELLKKIKVEKEKLIATGKLKKEKPLSPIREDEMHFDIPDGWVWCRLGDASINRDGERKPISLNDRLRREKIYDYYGASGIIDKIDGYTHDGRFLLIGEDGANLVSRSTPIAFVAIGKFWVNNHAHVLGFVNDITMRYFEIYINAIDLKNYITGGFQPKLSQGNMNLILVALPPIKEQERIVLKVTQLFETLAQIEKETKLNQQKAQDLMQAVLQEAFN